MQNLNITSVYIIFFFESFSGAPVLEIVSFWSSFLVLGTLSYYDILTISPVLETLIFSRFFPALGLWAFTIFSIVLETLRFYDFPCAGDFDFEQKSPYRDILYVGHFEFQQKISIRIPPCNGDFEFSVCPVPRKKSLITNIYDYAFKKNLLSKVWSNFAWKRIHGLNGNQNENLKCIWWKFSHSFEVLFLLNQKISWENSPSNYFFPWSSDGRSVCISI